MGLIRSLILWAVGFGIGFVSHNVQNSLLEKKTGIMESETLETDSTDVKNTWKHFKITTGMNVSALLVATFIPLQELKWLFFVGCGMLFAPVFYDVFYVCMSKTTQSKLRLLLTISSAINLLLVSYTLTYIYFGYLQWQGGNSVF